MITKETVDLVKKWEGFVPTTYRDEAGVLTIGYGTTGMAGVGIDPKPGMKITEAEAAEYLRRGLVKFSAQIDKMITADYNHNEFGAMLSLAYNIGPLAFSKSSVLRHFNAGNKAAAADAFRMWNKITDPKTGKKVTSNGLKKRREDARAMFLRPVVDQIVLSDDTQAPSGGLGGLIGAFIKAIIEAFKGR